MIIKDYKTPQTKVVEVYVQGVLCQSNGTRYGEEELEPGIFD